MNVRRRIAILVALILSSTTLFALNEHTDILRLHLMDKVHVDNEPTLDVRLPIKGGPSGSILFRRTSDEFYPVVISLRLDGKTGMSYRMSLVPGLQFSQIIDFGSDGNDTYLLVKHKNEQNESEYYIVSFSDDGSFESVKKLRIDWIPWQLGIFPDGNILLSGETRDGHSVIGIFDQDGGLLFRLRLRHDVSFNDSFSSFSTAETNRLVLQGSIIDRAGDNDLFLVRSTGPIFLIHSDGTYEIVSLQPPEGGNLVSVKVTNNRVAALYLLLDSAEPQLRSERVSIIDIATKKRIREFAIPKDIGLVFASYDSQRFLFLTGPQPPNDDSVVITIMGPP